MIVYTTIKVSLMLITRKWKAKSNHLQTQTEGKAKLKVVRVQKLWKIAILEEITPTNNLMVAFLWLKLHHNAV